MRRVILGFIVLATTPATTIAAEASRLTWAAEVGAVSDYRYRGLSLSDGGPAAQGGVTASLANGAYASVWASTIDEYGAGADGKGATVEVDYALGWAFEAAGVSIDAAVTRYTYPGAENVAYFELPLSVSRGWSDWTATVGGSYAPSQKALDHDDNRYVFAKLAWARPSAPVDLAVQVGREKGAYAPEGKWDWSASVSHRFSNVELGLALIDSDADAGALVASVTTNF
uniref:Porin domain-containing protein n=1 Tax=Caulobacter sp. (strain K31) TaxID=366602 RepID=B0SWN9_CAUSK